MGYIRVRYLLTSMFRENLKKENNFFFYVFFFCDRIEIWELKRENHFIYIELKIYIFIIYDIIFC